VALYDLDSGVIVAILAIAMALAIEGGIRLGLRRQREVSNEAKEQVRRILGALLGMFALLLGFALSLALQRYDARNHAVVDEANAIGSAYALAALLPAPAREEAQALLAHYVDLRIRMSTDTIHDVVRHEAALVEAGKRLDAVWAVAVRAADERPDPVRTGLFVQAVNDVGDQLAKRDAVLRLHIPELVIALLGATFLVGGVLLGYGAGLTGERASIAEYAMVGLIVVLMFIIIDLDRPRRGLIQVSQKSMTDLATLVRPPAAVPVSPGSKGRGP